MISEESNPNVQPCVTLVEILGFFNIQIKDKGEIRVKKKIVAGMMGIIVVFGVGYFAGQADGTETVNTPYSQSTSSVIDVNGASQSTAENISHSQSTSEKCLFGCGGNRSRLRRYEMGEVSGRLADLTIITSDNPRDEEPQAIIDDIKVGMAKTEGKYVEIPDRKEAIAYAIHHGEPGDIVVLAGKGHEDYQEIKGKKYPMDERVLIADILAGK